MGGFLIFGVAATLQSSYGCSSSLADRKFSSVFEELTVGHTQALSYSRFQGYSDRLVEA